MLRIDHISLPPGAPEGELRRQAAKILQIPESRIQSLRVVRRSVDAREGVSLVYSVQVAAENEAGLKAMFRISSQRRSWLNQPRQTDPS